MSEKTLQDELTITRHGAYLQDDLGRRWWNETLLHLSQSQKDSVAKVMNIINESARADHERNQARSEAVKLRAALVLSAVDVSLERTWCTICRTENHSDSPNRATHIHTKECILHTGGI